MEPETSEKAPHGRVERVRLFLNEVRNELKRVTWPSRRDVYGTTVVVILFSVVLGLYLWGVEQVLDRIVFWIMRRFGAG